MATDEEVPDLFDKLKGISDKLRKASAENPNEMVNKLADKFDIILDQFSQLDSIGKKEMGINLIKQFGEKAIEEKEAQMYHYKLIIMIACLFFIAFLLVFFGYKLYKSLKEKERKRDEKRKSKQQKKKK